MRLLLRLWLWRGILRLGCFVWSLRWGPRYRRAWLVLLGRALLGALRLLLSAPTNGIPERAQNLGEQAHGVILSGGCGTSAQVYGLLICAAIGSHET